MIKAETYTTFITYMYVKKIISTHYLHVTTLFLPLYFRIYIQEKKYLPKNKFLYKKNVSYFFFPELGTMHAFISQKINITSLI